MDIIDDLDIDDINVQSMAKRGLSVQEFNNIGELNNRIEDLFREAADYCTFGFFKDKLIPQFWFVQEKKPQQFHRQFSSSSFPEDLIIGKPNFQMNKADIVERVEKWKMKEDEVIQTLINSKAAIEVLKDVLDISNSNANILSLEIENSKSDEDLIKTMELLNKQLFQFDARGLITNYNRGRIAIIVKVRQPEKVYTILGIKSKSQINKLIRFYDFASKHTKILNCRVSFSYIVENMATISATIDKLQ